MSRVLVLDDDPDFCALLLPALAAGGIEAVQASRASDAEAKIGEAPFDLILVDGLLPDGHGAAFIERVRARDRAVRIVYVSAFFRDLETFRRLTTDLGVSLVVYKPIEPGELAGRILALLGRSNAAGGSAAEGSMPAAVDAGLEALERRFRARLPGRLEELGQALAEAQAGRIPLSDVRLLAHRLRGSAGSYGYPAVGAALGSIEDALAPLTGSTEVAPRRFFWAGLEDILRDARIAAVAGSGRRSPAADAALEPPRALLVVDEDPEVLAKARSLGRRLLVEIATAQSPDEALQRATTHRLLGAVLGVDAVPESALALARLLRNTPSHADLPIAFASGDGRLATRVAAIEAGGTRFLEKPISDESFTQLVQQLVDLASAQQGRVLILAADSSAAADYAAPLRSAGMAVDLLDHPEKIFDRLEEAHPDLLLLEHELPYLSGLDICRAVHMSDHWGLLPILLLSERNDPESRTRAYRAGAADVLSKPVVPVELMARVGVRLERQRLLRDRADKDTLTGLLVRRAFLEAVERSIGSCSRDRRPLSVVLIDVDHFKQVNDRYGHLAGDQVLARLGDLIRKRFRVEDLRCRWGGRSS